MNKTTILLFFFTLIFNNNSFAQEEESSNRNINQGVISNSYLQDRNGDGVVSILAFGDSITRGTGDFQSPNQNLSQVSQPPGTAGYPLRIETFLEIPVTNIGRAGEILSTDSIFRFANLMPIFDEDIVIISGGSNDSFFRIPANTFFRSVQTMINIAFASGKLPVLMTAPPTCCDRAPLNQFIDAYNDVYKNLASINKIPLADANRAFKATCRGSINNCLLLNRPEGLHPNILGYDVLGEVITATLLKIDILDSNGPKQLEEALGLAEGSIITQPETTVALEEEQSEE